MTSKCAKVRESVSINWCFDIFILSISIIESERNAADANTLNVYTADTHVFPFVFLGVHTHTTTNDNYKNVF